ncbi:MAG: twitching motility protein PilT [Firmicutes bacterium]|nr:twitching motility protein PilT [Bacillota bacterium]
MIQILIGEKGEGKTKRLIDMSNEAGKLSDGHIVFIDDDNRHMYDLHYNIRFVDTTGFKMEDQRIFFGFICGILSQDGDIEKIYIDGLNNIVKYMTDDDLFAFINELEKLSEKANVDFVMTISRDKETVPEALKSYLIS